jgi:hypothetical protein
MSVRLGYLGEGHERVKMMICAFDSIFYIDFCALYKLNYLLSGGCVE